MQFQPLGLGWLECLVQRRGDVDVDVVLHQYDLLGVGVVDLEQQEMDNSRASSLAPAPIEHDQASQATAEPVPRSEQHALASGGP